MSKTGFPIVDLLRRKLQTSLIMVTLTLSVASTLFLLLFSGHIGVGISAAKGTLTLGLTLIFGQFLLFMGILIFVVGAVLTSFTVFLMMAQRTRDFGLIKATGCPNSLVAGYFMTELLTVSTVGCVLGVAFGFLADFVASSLIFSGYSLTNWWFAPIIFVVFFVLAFVFGLQPLLKASRISAMEALSAVNYYGMTSEGKSKALSHSALSWRVASRSLIRRNSATFRIVILLSIVFVLLTVSVAGGIIAKDTTKYWMEKSVVNDAVAVANSGMGHQYELLLSKFVGVKETGNFDYSNSDNSIPNTLTGLLKVLPVVKSVDICLVLEKNIMEISNFTIIDNHETYVGDSREGVAIVIGVDTSIQKDIAIKGRSLIGNDSFEAVIGDSISQTMYLPEPRRGINMSDPLVEGLAFENSTFRIVGVCVDPINNGKVVYVPIDKMMSATGIGRPNILIVSLNDSIDRNLAIDVLRSTARSVDSNLEIFDLSGVMAQNQVFLDATWQTIMLLPTFTLAASAFCLVGYMLLAVDEQHQEFAILRAIGAKPKIVIFILAIQSFVVLISSFAVGTSLGTILTLLILMKQPLFTSFTILEIAGWFFIALTCMFLFSLYPAFKVAKAPILKIMS